MNSPQPGPLTSTEGLLPGDLLRHPAYGIVRVDASQASDDELVCAAMPSGGVAYAPPGDLSFVARPGIWQDWTGGENPLGPDCDILVECGFADGSDGVNEANFWMWNSISAPIIRWRIPKAKPNTSAEPVRKTPENEHVDWEVVGPKLVALIERVDAERNRESVRLVHLKRAVASIASEARAALAATQGEGVAHE